MPQIAGFYPLDVATDEDTKEFFDAYSAWCDSNSEEKQFNKPNGLTKELKGKGFKASFSLSPSNLAVSVELSMLW